MRLEVKKALRPFKILTIIGIVGTIGLILVYIYTLSADKLWVHSLAERTAADIMLLCQHENCTYVYAHNSYYEINTERSKLVLLNNNPIPTLGWLDTIMLTERNIDEYDTIIYSLDITSFINTVVIYGLVGLLLLIIIMGIVAEKRFICISEHKIDAIKEKSSLENNLKMLIAATAHHEMLTPIAVIKASIDNLSAPACSSQDDKTKDTFDILTSAVSRLESVLNQMSSDRKLYKKRTVPIANILKSTINALQVICTEFNFKYYIKNEVIMTNVRNYKLDSGTISNIFNNLFKNSLEAGATVIKIVPILEADILTVLVLDNGSGIIVSKADELTDVFKLGYTNKESDLDIINVNKRLNTTRAVRGDGLFLVKSILEGGGGGIELLNTSPEGTVFKITLPIKRITENDDEGGR